MAPSVFFSTSPMSLKQRGVAAFSWSFFGGLANHGVTFVFSVFLARLLEPSDFGLIAIIMVIIGIASVFTDIGLGSALIQRRKVHSVHYSSVFYFNVVVGFFLTLVTYHSAEWVSEFYQEEQLIMLIQALSFLFVINALSSVQNTRLRKELNYARLTKVSFISSLISGVVGIYLAMDGAGVWSLVVQILTMAVLYNVLIWTVTNWHPSFAFSWKALKQLWGFGFRMFLIGLLDAITTKIDFLIIGKILPLATLGYFQRAKSLNNMVVQYSSGSLMAVLFPILSKIQNDLPRFQKIILKSLGIISFVVFLLVGSLFLISEELIVLFFSAKWLPSVEFFKILVLSGFAYPISALLVNVLSSRGKSKEFLRLAICKKLIVFSNLVILYFMGINFFLYGLIAQGVLGVSLNIVFVSREIQLPFKAFSAPILMQGAISVAAVILTMFMVGDLELTNLFMILIKGSVFAMLYFVLSYIIKTSSYAYFIGELTPFIYGVFSRPKES